MQNYPTISFIIPVFNSDKTIKNTISSVYSQLDNTDELIIINDGSTDNTKIVLSEFKKSNINVVHQKNHGVSFSRNVGAKIASCDIIAFLDSDDILNHKIVGKVKESFNKNKDINWAFGYYNILSSNQFFTVRNKNLPSGIHKSVFELYDGFNNKKTNELITTCSVYFRRTSFLKSGGFDESMISGEDTFLWLKFGLLNPEIFYLDTLTFYYNRNDLINERNTHKHRSKDELLRIKKGLDLIKKTAPYNYLSLRVLNIWLYRHLKFCIRSLQFQKIIVLIKIKFQIFMISFTKWI